MGWPQVAKESSIVRNGHAMVYDESLRRVILFGGADASSVRDDTWAWDEANRRWQRLKGPGPGPRTFPAFAYDAKRQEAVLFGGNRVLFGTGEENDTILGDTWIFHKGQWSRRVAAGPHARAEAGMAYDRLRQRIVLFGGYYRDETGTTRLGDTWEWDGQRWRLMATSGPRPRSGLALAYDERRCRVVLFGGSGLASDTWEWDGTQWTEVAAGNVPGRFNPVMIYDPTVGGLVRFGGWNGKTRVAETWILRPTGWKRLDIPGPSARNHAAFVYDRSRRRGVLFGGHDGEHVFGDVWEWNGSRWSSVLDVDAQERVENSH